MADTILEFNVEAGKDFFHVYDRTGSYGKKNKGGWGSPNDKVSDVKSAKVRIYLPGSDDYIEVDVFPNLPNTDCIGFEIIPNDLNLDAFDPGVYKFEFINELVTLNCQAEIILISGQSELILNAAESLAKAKGLNVIATLRKPFDIDEFEALLLAANNAA